MTPFLFTARKLIVASGAKPVPGVYRLSRICRGWRTDQLRYDSSIRTAAQLYVDKIFKGVKPADLPVRRRPNTN